MKILLFGANGQLGQAIQAVVNHEKFPIGWTMIAFNKSEGDLLNPDALLKRMIEVNPDIVINAAAYTQVDLAETNQSDCRKINSETPAKIAAFCASNSILLVHFSTDYVYGDSNSGPHLETESPNPFNFYGKSKAEGDFAIQNAGCEFLIFRTSWVYSSIGKNFLITMKRISLEREELKVVDDQWGSPTYAPDLARYSIECVMLALEQKAEGKAFPNGIYHLCNSGKTNWCDFALSILKHKKIIGIPSSEFPSAASRPKNSVLCLDKLKSTFGIEPRPWFEALKECLLEIKDKND